MRKTSRRVLTLRVKHAEPAPNRKGSLDFAQQTLRAPLPARVFILKGIAVLPAGRQKDKKARSCVPLRLSCEWFPALAS